MHRLPLLALLLLFVAAPTAQAAVVRAQPAPQKIKVDAAAGEANRFSVTQIGDVVTIEDTGAPLSVEPGQTTCAASGTQVTCTLPSPAWTVQLDAGDGDDQVTAATLG